MVLTKQEECLPCFGGDGPNALKNKKSSRGDMFSRSSPSQCSEPCASRASCQSNEPIEQLQGIVQGEYKGVNVSKCSEAVKLFRKRRDAAKAAAALKIDPCCCKGPCTLISSLLKKLKNTSTVSERKSLTCIIFNELCKLSGADPCKKQDEKRNTALALAKKFGAWIDDMLEKKGTITCGDIEIDPKTQKMMGDIFECPCCQKKKEYPERKPKIVKPKEPPPRPVYQYCPPKKTKKKKPKKKGEGDGDGDGVGGKGGKGGKGGVGVETEEERALRLEAEAKAAAEAAAAEAAAKAAAACKAAAQEKRQQAMEEQMARQREEVAKQATEKSHPPPKIEPTPTPSQPIEKDTHGKKGKKGDDETREKKSKVTTKVSEPKTFKAENVVTIPPNMKICVSASGGVKRRGRGTSSTDQVDSSKEDQGMSDQDTANVIEQYSKIVQHFLGTLDDMNDWIQNLVRETDQVIIAKIDGSDMNVLGEVEQDWKIFKNKMFLKTHHWKYFNKVAKKMVSQLQDPCSCETKSGSCKCPGKQCASRSTGGSVVCHAKHMKMISPAGGQHGNNSSIISEPPSLKPSSYQSTFT